MTDPTADAFAALTHAAERLRILSNGYSGRADDAGRLARDMEQISAYCREASAELLSAQGQAGKPVAWRVKDFADGWIIFQDKYLALKEADKTGALIEPLFTQASALATIKGLET